VSALPSQIDRSNSSWRARRPDAKDLPSSYVFQACCGAARAAGSGGSTTCGRTSSAATSPTRRSSQSSSSTSCSATGTAPPAAFTPCRLPPPSLHNHSPFLSPENWSSESIIVLCFNCKTGRFILLFPVWAYYTIGYPWVPPLTKIN
jgi:hypothetical protein